MLSDNNIPRLGNVSIMTYERWDGEGGGGMRGGGNEGKGSGGCQRRREDE